MIARELVEHLQAHGGPSVRFKRNREGDYHVTCPNPSHPDPDPSLHVTDRDGKVLLRCMAGCPTQTVLDAAGLEWGDLFHEAGNGRREIVASYAYTDPDGRLAFEAVRYWPKDFRQRRPDGAGGWHWNLDGVTRWLYRMPRVLEAIERGQSIFIPEGERDVDALEALGLYATCNPMGAGKWRDEHSRMLTGASDVIVVRDRDDAGREHAQQVLDSLRRHAGIEATLLEPREGKDVSEHLTAGHDWTALVEVESEETRTEPETGPAAEPAPGKPERVSVEAVPITQFTARPVEWLWPGRVPRGMQTLLYGMPDRGKSLLSMLITAERTRAGERVLIATAEDSIEAVVKPRLAAVDAVLGLVEVVKVQKHGLEDGLTLPDDAARLEALVREHEARLLIIDPLNAHLPGTVNSLIDASVRRALAPLHRLAEGSGCSVMPIGHVNKSQGTTDPLLRVGGSIGLPGAVRSMLLLTNDPDDPEGASRVLAHTKCNVGLKQRPHLTYAIEPVTVELDGKSIETARLKHTGESHHSVEALLGVAASPGERSDMAEVVEWLARELEGGPVAVKNIMAKARQMGLPDRTVRTAAKDHLHVVSDKVGWAADGIWSWRLPDAGEADDRG
jgi:putative DNA primase/helicase